MSQSDSGLPPSSRLVSSPTPPLTAGLAAMGGPKVRTVVGGCAALAMGMLLVWELVASISSTGSLGDAGPGAAGGTVRVASPSAVHGSRVPVVTATPVAAPSRDRSVPQVRRPDVRRPERPRADAPRHAHPVHPAHPAHHHPRPRHQPTSAPATPGWVRAECLRRFGHDAARRMACEAVLAQVLAH